MTKLITPASFALPRRRRSLLSLLWQALLLYRQQRRTMGQLERLDAHLRRDIGLPPADRDAARPPLNTHGW